MTSVLAILGGAVPVYFCSIGKSIIDILIGVFVIMYSIYKLLIYCLENNINHMEQQKKYFDDAINKQTNQADVLHNQLVSLNKHLFLQNLFAMVALMFYSVIFIFLMLLSYFFIEENNIDKDGIITKDDKSVKEFFGKFFPPKYK